MKRVCAGVVLGAMLASCGGPAPDLPYGPPQQLMAQQVEPAAQTFWQSVRFESRLMPDGSVRETDYRPDSDAEWEEVRAAAAHLGNMGRVLKTPAYADGRGPAWLTYAQGLVDASAQAEAAARAKDPDAVFEVGGTVYAVCRACHQSYPPEELPEGMSVDDLPAEGQ